MVKANPKELAVYEQRLQKASSFARPTRPTKVYLWKVAGDIDGDLPEDLYWLDVRVPVAARAVGEMWPIYPDSHKLYDARADEWDICPALAPEDDVVNQELLSQPRGRAAILRRGIVRSLAGRTWFEVSRTRPFGRCAATRTQDLWKAW